MVAWFVAGFLHLGCVFIAISLGSTAFAVLMAFGASASAYRIGALTALRQVSP